MPQTFTKDTDAKLDYPIIWYDWLDGDTLSSHTVTADSGITVVSSDINVAPVTIGARTYPANTVITIWLSGGTAGASYDLVVRVVTAGGRQTDRTITVWVEEK